MVQNVYVTKRTDFLKKLSGPKSCNAARIDLTLSELRFRAAHGQGSWRVKSVLMAGSSTLKDENEAVTEESMSLFLAVTCGFRFEVRPEDEVVVLEADHRTVHVCVDCLTLLTVHRRIHHMKVEKVIVEMAERRPLVA